jgi:adenine-specific DNA-methyltransferase
MPDKNKYGQYMTPPLMADFMVSLASVPANGSVLEPASGEGIFLSTLRQRGFQCITAFEIDSGLAGNDASVFHRSFVSAKLHGEFDLIIGNPPYIRWKHLEPELKEELEHEPLWQKHCNSLCDYSAMFILKAVDLLKAGGQLIFITPAYWLSTSHSAAMREYLLENGCFESIYHFGESPVFEDAAVSTIVFKYVKGQPDPRHAMRMVKVDGRRHSLNEVIEAARNPERSDFAETFELPQFPKRKRWILAPESTQQELRNFEQACSAGPLFGTERIGNVCDIGNGMVSGLDRAFQLDKVELTPEEMKSTIAVIKAKHLQRYHPLGASLYFFPKKELNEQSLSRTYPNVYAHLQAHRKELENRYQYGRTIPIWEWVFPRSKHLFERPVPKIFIPCKERVTHKSYFRFALVSPGYFPTQDVTCLVPKPETKESIDYILAFLNSKYVFDWLLHNGIVKGGVVEFSERPLASIPFRRIDFSSRKERELHDRIAELAHSFAAVETEVNQPEMDALFSELLAVTHVH